MKNYPYTFDIIDVPRGFSVEQLEMSMEEIKSNYTPDVIFIDYMGLMEDASDSDEDDWLTLGKIAGRIHEVARSYQIPIVSAVQLNRMAPGSKNTVGMHRIGRSSLIATHCTAIIQIETRVDEARYDDFIYHIIKNRNGESGKSHTIYKNFSHCSLIDKQYDCEDMKLWTQDDNIGIDVSDILGNLDD
jgi:replicative DNA helicase